MHGCGFLGLFFYTFANPRVFKNLLIYFFRERGREGEREGEKPQCVVASHSAPSGDLACNPGMCPDQESNWRPSGLQDDAEPTELHQSGQSYSLAKVLISDRASSKVFCSIPGSQFF